MILRTLPTPVAELALAWHAFQARTMSPFRSNAEIALLPEDGTGTRPHILASPDGRWQVVGPVVFNHPDGLGRHFGSASGWVETGGLVAAKAAAIASAVASGLVAADVAREAA